MAPVAVKEIQKEAAQHRGVGDAAKEVMRDQLGGLLHQVELQKQNFQVTASASMCVMFMRTACQCHMHIPNCVLQLCRVS